MEATFADLSSRVAVIFPNKAVKLWQTKARSLLTSFPSGSLFHILQSELRISDCFFPPRIELWVKSFCVVGGLDNKIPHGVTELGASSNLRRLLKMYMEAHEHKLITSEDALILSSPLRSQESICASNGDLDVANNIENDEAEPVSQPFYTQISQNAALQHTREPPKSEQLRTSHNSKPLLHRQHFSTSEDEGHWPGGRTSLQNGRYLPRYLTKVPKDQQEILATLNAWQPSKTARQIRGSVPNQILKEFTELADKRAEIAPSDEELNLEGSRDTGKPGGDDQPDQGIGKGRLDSASDSEESEYGPWSPTPSSAVREPAFPANSSPLQAPCERVTPSLSMKGNTIASTHHASGQEQGCEAGSPVPSHEEGTGPEVRGALQATENSSCGQQPSGPTTDVSRKASFGEDSLHVRHMPSPKRPLSPSRDHGQLQDAEHFNKSSRQPHQDDSPHGTDSLSSAPRTQRDLSHQRTEAKTLIQVQRTPFVHQVSPMMMKPDCGGHRGSFPYLDTKDSVPHNRECKSSPSVVLGTFANVGKEERTQPKVLSTKPLHDELNTCADQLMEVEGRSEMMRISKAAKAVGAALVTKRSSRSGALSESERTFLERRPAKRKQCNNDDAQPAIQPQRSTEGCRPRPSPAVSKRPRMMSRFPSLEALKDLDAAKAPSEIARESRREFLRNQERAASNSSPLSVAIPTFEQTDRDRQVASSYATSGEVFHLAHQHHTTPGTSLLSRPGLKAESGVDVISGLSLRPQSMYETYKAAYPEYEGNMLQFHKACKQIKILHAEGKAPHPSLWDDFIFRRHHDYRRYLLQITEACEDAVPFLQYYTEHVEMPSRMRLVIRPSYILTLATDSAIGSSIKSPPPVPQVHLDTAEGLRKSVAASSSASNIVPRKHDCLSDLAFNHQSRQEPRCELNSDTQDETEQTRDSSVKQWVVLQSIEKVLGAESPELGNADAEAEEEEVPPQDLETSTEIPLSSSPGPLSAASEPEGKESVWCDDPNTPFKSFARSYVALASERRKLPKPVTVDEKGCLKPQVQSVIEIFTSYRK